MQVREFLGQELNVGLEVLDVEAQNDVADVDDDADDDNDNET